MAALGALGYRQGGVKVAFSLVGILLGAVLAVPLGRLIMPGFKVFGLKNPLLIWALAPFIVFVLINAIFKIAAFTVHHKVDVFYKYKAGDLRLALWERLNHRTGLCLGLANGAAYFILICFIAFAMSYWTTQMATPDSDPKALQIVNRLGQDLQSTGFAKVARAVDGLPNAFYEAADIAGLLYNNPLLEARLSRYPGLLAIGERQEFQDISSDREFTELRQKREPIKSLLDNAKTQAVINNPDLLKQIWTTATPDLKDLNDFLLTGLSAKYDSEKILGRWNFDVNSAIILVRKARPNISSLEMQKVKRWMAVAFAKTVFVGMPDHQVVLKDLPRVRTPTPAAPIAPGAAPPPLDLQTIQGQWQSSDNKYVLTMSGGQPLIAAIEGDRLSVTLDGTGLVFVKED